MELKAIIDEAKDLLLGKQDLMNELAQRGISAGDVAILIPDYTGERLEYHQGGSSDRVMVICSRDFLRCELWTKTEFNRGEE